MMPSRKPRFCSTTTKAPSCCRRQRTLDDRFLRRVGDAGTRAFVRGAVPESTPLEQDPSAEGFQIAHQQTHQRGLADAVASEHAQDGAGRDLRPDVAQDDGVAIAAIQRLDLQQCTGRR